ncbi:hypothetical protein CMI46_03000 [Candidatus Pacearchaeota archaeon]|nr:hypothetical protein [Candidatus Pacearchaeota archaeon]|tara:strand:- start:8401 stop:8805 length:405 start_codon:yes stop_codon:yes gene_type:complete
MADPIRKVFYRRAIKVGNSSGVLLPKALLDADVRVAVIRPPRNIKKDSMKILTPILEHILGVYIINQTPKKAELLAISTNINQHMTKGQYEIDVVPLNHLKKSLKEKPETKEKIKKAKTVINAKLLSEIRKEIR